MCDAGPDANGVLWLEGDGCPLLVVGLADGTMRRFSLARSPAALGCNLSSTIDGITSLSYSENLKLVGYATGGGEAGVLACMARINPLYIEQNGWIGAIRCVPRAPLLKVSYSTETKRGAWSVVSDKEIPTVAPSEYWRGVLTCVLPGLPQHAATASGYRTDREITNIQNYFLGLTWRKLCDYGKHWPPPQQLAGLLDPTMQCCVGRHVLLWSEMYGWCVTRRSAQRRCACMQRDWTSM